MIAVGVRSIRDTSGLITHWDRIIATQQAIDSNAAGKAFSDKQTSKRLLGLEGNEVDVLDQSTGGETEGMVKNEDKVLRQDQ